MRRAARRARRELLRARIRWHRRRGIRRFDEELQIVSAPPPEEIARIRVRLLGLLNEDLLPFWFPACVRSDGSFSIRHDDAGNFDADHSLSSLSQASVLWFLARWLRFTQESSTETAPGSPLDRRQVEAWLAAGRRTFLERFWDDVHGGWFLAERPSMGGDTRKRNGSKTNGGKRKGRSDAGGSFDDRKHVYPQSFALFALAEIARACPEDEEALDAARRTFELLEARCHDEEHGGYRESFRRDWRPSSPDETSPMGEPSAAKQFNSHVHLLEAMTALIEVWPEERVQRRLRELISIQSDAVIRAPWALGTDLHAADWNPVLSPRYARAKYGHDVENVWLLVAALEAAGDPVDPHLGFLEKSFRSAIEYGWNWERGGLMRSGPLGRVADNLHRVWWVQAEALVCALALWRHTGRLGYWGFFVEILRWIEQAQMDRFSGDWFTVLGADGHPIQGKSLDEVGSAKTPYHHGRALILCLEMLDAAAQNSRQAPAE